MPINPVTLAPAVVSAAGSTDVVGIAAWTAITGVLATWLLTGIPTPTLPISDPLIAVGVVITGTGSIVYADAGASLGLLLAAAAGSVDVAGIAAWSSVGLALGAWMNTNAQIDPSTLVAVVGGPNPNPVGGVGGVAFASQTLGPTLALAAGSVDPPGAVKWLAIGNAILSHMETFASVAPGSMVSPPTGGPVTGTGILS
jgi:hypothetical protein